ncbi:MAG: hypothetical protein M1514_01555 [Patescibacteria group bacterium]|nr:hypothetical protein [Patescibacteria group bacterium]
MEVPPAEIFDRYTILLLKVKRLPEGKGFREQLKLYKSEVNNICNGLDKGKLKKIKEFIKRLYIINKNIWDVEKEIKQGYEDKLSLEEVGRRALIVRDLNGTRMKLKNEIYEFLGQPLFVDIKTDYVSDKMFKKPLNKTTSL